MGLRVKPFNTIVELRQQLRDIDSQSIVMISVIQLAKLMTLLTSHQDLKTFFGDTKVSLIP